MSATFDPIGLIEAAYEPSADTAQWLRTLAPRIAHPIDVERTGICSYFVRAYQPLGVHWEPGAVGDLVYEDCVSAVSKGWQYASHEQRRRFVLTTHQPGVHSFVEALGSMVEPALDELPRRVGDSPAVVIPTGGDLVGIVATLTTHPLSFAPETRALWERIAIHLGAACRLVSRPADADAGDVEAVLDPGGAILDARGQASRAELRKLLHGATRRMDRARTRAGRADPLHALELWHGLLAGRWSLVDHVERDGRRLVLARRNEPEGRVEHATLSPRQRQVLFYASVGWSLKQVAYALGLAEGTITHHLRAALRKLGVSSRAELVRVTTEIAVEAMVRGLRPPDPAPTELETLTAAERAVVDGVIASWSNERIAEARGVSLHTVANQLTSVYRKLGLRGRHELVRWAARRARR